MSEKPQHLDKETTDGLIASKLPSVEKIINQTASSFPSYVDRDELYGAGCLGLVEAAQRFDPSKGFSFSTWAEYRIRGAVLDYARSQDKLSQTNRRDARQLQLAVDELSQIQGRPPTNAELGKHLQWSTYKVQDVKEFSEKSKPVVQSVEQYDQGSVSGFTDRNSKSSEETVEDNELLEMLRVGLYALSEKQREIVVSLYVEGATTKDVAERCGLSMSRVAQIRNETLEILKEALTAHLDATPTIPTRDGVSKNYARSRDMVLAELKNARSNRPSRPIPPRPRQNKTAVKSNKVEKVENAEKVTTRRK